MEDYSQHIYSPFMGNPVLNDQALHRRLDELTAEPLGPAQMPGPAPATGLPPVVQDGPIPVIRRVITSRIIEVITPVTAMTKHVLHVPKTFLWNV